MSRKVTYIKTSSINRKIFQLLMAVALIIVTLNLWVDINQKGEQLLAENAIVLAENILKQTSNSAAFYIVNDDVSSLDLLTQSALKSDHIHEMIIYNKDGKILSQSETALPAKIRFIEQADVLKGYLPVPYVHEITENDELVGFVRVTVLTKNLQKKGMNYIYTLTKQVLLITLLAGIIGYLFTNGLKPFSANAYIVRD